eukprot:CAMPEP_0181191682 /NCGR_PEP_ID=MMETSP1096-20121128/12865_1 /TAXON_ID=156174 ORGANISM="Chrysochromulina ericina, Strain CCMP281" /NCGR_SAMPLE_ID=MMETSP1096 /ASSEMBLY_ACC=CAM_ASM_000453 /LENGTH=102 /DNA_ID=CAMNT_0023280997 /DNA_START=527 /DNA_END=836 /DNA_ORIENTATION=-
MHKKREAKAVNGASIIPEDGLREVHGEDNTDSTSLQTGHADCWYESHPLWAKCILGLVWPSSNSDFTPGAVAGAVLAASILQAMNTPLGEVASPKRRWTKIL